MIRRFCAVLVALAITMSGLGLQTAHAAASHDVQPVETSHMHHDHGDHASHAAMTHHQNMSHDDMPDAHENHSDCTSAACCHLGGVVGFNPRPSTNASTAAFVHLGAHQYTDAEKDRADKPPKHV